MPRDDRPVRHRVGSTIDARFEQCTGERQRRRAVVPPVRMSRHGRWRRRHTVRRSHGDRGSQQTACQECIRRCVRSLAQLEHRHSRRNWRVEIDGADSPGPDVESAGGSWVFLWFQHLLPTGSSSIDPRGERKMTTVLHHGVMQQAVN